MAVVHTSLGEKILYMYSYPQFELMYSFGEVGKASEEFRAWKKEVMYVF